MKGQTNNFFLGLISIQYTVNNKCVWLTNKQTHTSKQTNKQTNIQKPKHGVRAVNATRLTLLNS